MHGYAAKYLCRNALSYPFLSCSPCLFNVQIFRHTTSQCSLQCHTSPYMLLPPPLRGMCIKSLCRTDLNIFLYSLRTSFVSKKFVHNSLFILWHPLLSFIVFIAHLILFILLRFCSSRVINKQLLDVPPFQGEMILLL